MGSLRAASAAMFVLAACSSNNNQVSIDAPPPIDAPPDAPPDVPIDGPAGDFSCLGATAGTTAADPITIAGTTSTFSAGGLTAAPGTIVDSFKLGQATKLDEVTSDAAGGFTTGNLVTGGTPLAGYLEASVDGARTTFLFPPSPLVASVTGIPVPLVTTQIFSLGEMGAGVTQDDTVNGAIFIAITDCVGMRLKGADVTVKQGGADVGTILSLGNFQAALDGLYFVFNVPDGATDVGAKFANMTFATHSVLAFKGNNTDIKVGSVTATTVQPGP